MLRRPDADYRAPAGPELAPLSRAQARRLVTTVTQPHPCRTDLMARRIDGDGSPRRASSGAAGKRPCSATGTVRKPVSAAQDSHSRSGETSGARLPRRQPLPAWWAGTLNPHKRGSSSAVQCNKIFKTPSAKAAQVMKSPGRLKNLFITCWCAVRCMLTPTPWR